MALEANSVATSLSIEIASATPTGETTNSFKTAREGPNCPLGYLLSSFRPAAVIGKEQVNVALEEKQRLLV